MVVTEMMSGFMRNNVMRYVGSFKSFSNSFGSTW